MNHFKVYRALLVPMAMAVSQSCSPNDSPGESTGGSAGSLATAGAGAGGSGTAGAASGSGGVAASGGSSATAGTSGSGGQGGALTTGGAPGTGGFGAGGSSGGTDAGVGGTSGSGGSGAGTAGATSSSALAILTDTNRDGAIDQNDRANFTDWAWKGDGAFFIANVDDDDDKGTTDAGDQKVNGADDELDLARIRIEISPEAAASAVDISASVTMGAAHVHLFEKTSAGFSPVDETLSQVSAPIELGIEATQFADTEWDGFVTVKVDVRGAGGSSIASEETKLHVAPWIMLPQSAKTELLYISSTTARLHPGLNAALGSVGLPDVVASNPGQQDLWFQDTMEIGYTQLPGSAPMHVVMRAQRPNASDDVAITLLAPDFGYISIGEPREPPDEQDHWIDWMGNLEVTHPVPGYPLGRIYYGKSDRTTFHPTILEFLEAQKVQPSFAIDTGWLVIQHVDEVMNFLPDEEGNAKLIIVSPEAARTVLGTSTDAGNQEVQAIIDDTIAVAKTELGLGDDDIIELPTLFQAEGADDYAPEWSNPVNSVLAGNTFMVGNTNTPEAIKSSVEDKLGTIGVLVSWVDDSEYHPWGGNVHCGTNTKKTPICMNFAECIP